MITKLIKLIRNNLFFFVSTLLFIIITLKMKEKFYQKQESEKQTNEITIQTHPPYITSHTDIYKKTLLS